MAELLKRDICKTRHSSVGESKRECLNSQWGFVTRSSFTLPLPRACVPEAASVQGAGGEGEGIALRSPAHHGASPATGGLGMFPPSHTTAFNTGTHYLFICKII